MISRVAIHHGRTPPMVLKFTDIRSYIFSMTFVALSVLVPWVFHQFHLAGPTFLPMHIFVLVGGLLFGWRAGLVIGLLTPVTSYAISGMPVPVILPQTIVELSAYGMISGLLRERFGFQVVWSLLGAIAGGRLALLFSATVVYFSGGGSSSPLGAESSPLFVLWSVIRQGWPGIAIQVVSIPLLTTLLEKSIAKVRASKHEWTCV